MRAHWKESATRQRQRESIHRRPALANAGGIRNVVERISCTSRTRHSETAHLLSDELGPDVRAHETAYHRDMDCVTPRTGAALTPVVAI